MPPTINYFGRNLEIRPDPMIGYWVAAYRGNATGLLALSSLGIIVLALGWPHADCPAPWLVAEQTALDDADGACRLLEGELKASHKLGQTDADRQEIRRELAAAVDRRTEAKAALRAATVSDVPARPEVQAVVAARIQDAFIQAGVPAPVLANWAMAIVAAIGGEADAGWQEWARLEAANFSRAPAGISSSGASDAPVVNAEMPSAGSP